jgi:hypothetical protein
MVRMLLHRNATTSKQVRAAHIPTVNALQLAWRQLIWLIGSSRYWALAVLVRILLQLICLFSMPRIGFILTVAQAAAAAAAADCWRDSNLIQKQQHNMQAVSCSSAKPLYVPHMTDACK